MQVYYEMETDIPVNHQVYLQLPDNIPPGRAKIAIIYELTDSRPTKTNRMIEFLNNLPEEETPGLSREQIQTYLNEERASWDK